jgi:hypothetical protein
MGHLDSQRSLPVLGDDKTGFSPMAKKLRLAAGHRVAVLNAPAGYLALLSRGRRTSAPRCSHRRHTTWFSCS